MKNNLLFDFLVDKEKNTLTVKKEFAAGQQLVWDCHTKREYLDQWFAPKPFRMETRSMDFRAGGFWHYCMIDPEGKKYCGRMDYLAITPIKSYSALDGFCDEQGVLNTDLPRATWDAAFESRGTNTLVQTVVRYKSLADLEVVIQMGMKEGLTATLEQLDELLLTLNK